MRSQLDVFARSFLNGRDGLELTPVFERFFEDPRHSRTQQRAAFLTPACDLTETENHFLISLDMPGVAKEDIKIEVLEQQLTISAERPRETAEKATSRHLIERGSGRFQRVFNLGNGVNLERIEAVYKDGVLRVALPKKEAPKPKVVSISSEDHSGLFATPTAHKEGDAESIN